MENPLKKLLDKLKASYATYSYVEKVFIVCMMICSFVITAEAAITRGVSASYFLKAYKAKFFPYAWMASLPLNFVVVALYNRFISRFGPKKVMACILAFAFLFNGFCALYLKSLYYLPFLLYLWKDIFIIFLFHKLWSVIHSTIPKARAKYIYGMFYGLGGLGSILGNMVPGFMAVLLGTEKLLLVTLPLYIITYLAYSKSMQVQPKIASSQSLSLSIDNGDLSYGVRLIQKSKPLKFILLLVLCIQVASTILDYQWNTLLEVKYPVLDIRTQFAGRLFGIVNIMNVFLQFGTIFLLRLVGLRGAHTLIPLILLCNGALFLAYPVFGVICISFGTIKSLDYSIFGITKEMLYLPLGVEEKFKAKSIIDVFAYRSAKAVVFFLIAFLTYVYGENITMLLSFVLMAIFLLWTYSIYSMREYFVQIEGKETPEEIV